MTSEAKAPERRWLSVDEAVEYTGTDADWILGHVKSGALKAVATARRKRADGPGPRRLRIDRLKLDALMERLETGGAEPEAPAPAPPAQKASARPLSFRELRGR